MLDAWGDREVGEGGLDVCFPFPSMGATVYTQVNADFV